MKKDDKSKSSIKTIVKVPSDHAKLPLWAAVRPKEKRIVRVSGRVIEVGGFDPFEPEKKDVPTLSIAHGRVFYTLMSFREPFSTANTVTFSLNKFFDRFKRPAGGKNYRDVRRLFRDLSQAYFRITEKNGNRYTYRILKDIGFVEVPKRKESKKAGDTELRTMRSKPTLGWMASIHYDPQSLRASTLGSPPRHITTIRKRMPLKFHLLPS